jgi:hypothetical protein
VNATRKDAQKAIARNARWAKGASRVNNVNLAVTAATRHAAMFVWTLVQKADRKASRARNRASRALSRAAVAVNALKAVANAVRPVLNPVSRVVSASSVTP